MTMTVADIIEDFWFEWEDQELTHEERREQLIDAGCDPDAMVHRIKLLISETKANREMEKRFREL